MALAVMSWEAEERGGAVAVEPKVVMVLGRGIVGLVAWCFFGGVGRLLEE